MFSRKEQLNKIFAEQKRLVFLQGRLIGRDLRPADLIRIVSACSHS
jgi:hypothetical protein